MAVGQPACVYEWQSVNLGHKVLFIEYKTDLSLFVQSVLARVLSIFAELKVRVSEASLRVLEESANMLIDFVCRRGRVNLSDLALLLECSHNRRSFLDVRPEATSLY